MAERAYLRKVADMACTSFSERFKRAKLVDRDSRLQCCSVTFKRGYEKSAIRVLSSAINKRRLLRFRRFKSDGPRHPLTVIKTSGGVSVRAVAEYDLFKDAYFYRIDIQGAPVAKVA